MICAQFFWAIPFFQCFLQKFAILSFFSVDFWISFFLWANNNNRSHQEIRKKYFASVNNHVSPVERTHNPRTHIYAYKIHTDTQCTNNEPFKFEHK